MAPDAADTKAALDALNDRLSQSIDYGLDHEKAKIVEIYDRIRTKSTSSDDRTELILIRGLPGTGKEHLLEDLLSPLVQQDHGFCVAGRFDQLSQNQKPYDAFVETFSSYVEMLIKRDDRKIGADLSKIEGIDLLLKMIPALRRLIPQVEQPDETTSKDASCDFDFQNASLRDASNLSKIVLRLFLRTIASKGRPPLVIALEHLHWADEAALDVLLSLLSDSVHQRILFVATEREDLSTPALATMLQRIHVNEVTLTHIHLLNMDEEATTQFVTHMLAVDPDVAESLASAVFPSTRGNRYFTRVLLQNLARKGVLKCNDASGRHKWSWDTDEIRRECQTSMEDTLQARLLELPNSVMRLLRYASFLGFRLNTEILSYLMEERIDSYLQVAEDGGLVARSGSHGWEFTNETVQDAAFGLVPNDERELFHLRIGRRLWKHFDLKKLDKHIFIVVEELLAGERLVTDARERVAIAKLCLRAAEQSVHMSSFQTAYYYYERGIALLGPKRWEENYELTLELYDHAVEVAFCIGKFTELYKLVDDVVLHAHCFSDTLRSHATKIFALGTNLKTRQAMAHALEILSQLDVCFPKKPSLIRTVFECQRLRRRLKRKSSQSLQRIPFLKDESKLIAMRILCQFVFEALLLDDPVAPLIIFRMVSFSLDHGICAMSSLGFALFGALLCGPCNDIDEGFRIGQAGLAMYDLFQVRVWLPRLSAVYYSGVHTFQEKATTCLEPLLLGQQIGIESGDLESALMCGVLHNFIQLETRPLLVSEAGYLLLRDQAMFYGQSSVTEIIKPSLQVILNLLGRGNASPSLLYGDVLSKDDLARLESTGGLILAYTRCYMTMLACMFGNLEMVPEFIKVLQAAVKHAIGAIDLSTISFYIGIGSVSLYREWRRGSDLRMARKQLQVLRSRARHSAHVFLPHQLILQAELAAATGRGKHIHSMFMAAIAQARASGSLYLLALGNELAGKHFLGRNEYVTAWTFLRPALHHYDAWGAKAKVDHLAGELKHVPEF